MSAITGGNIISNTTQIEGSKARTLPWHGAPGTVDPNDTYPDIRVVGTLVVDVDTQNVYEYSEPAAVPTWTRIDTA